ncbi:hypothetical protein ALT_3767 [Aspergillus lentulus]|uniref:Uncharacterized protein n=1 Tax=Aspergillus lentulus TaxID=293939 RepID=A0AAN4PI77_ASPLE|nr:hypothetical protein ALT_3767 [Aspergillus lentulus]
MVRPRVEVRVVAVAVSVTVTVTRLHRLFGRILALAEEGILAAVEAVTALEASEALLTLYRCRRMMAPRFRGCLAGSGSLDLPEDRCFPLRSICLENRALGGECRVEDSLDRRLGAVEGCNSWELALVLALQESRSLGSAAVALGPSGGFLCCYYVHIRVHVRMDRVVCPGY